MRTWKAWAAAVALAMPALAQAAPEPRTDAEIAKDARQAVLGYVRYSVFDAVGVAVKDGVVTLGGFVLDDGRRDDIEGLIKDLPGVREVKDQIVLESAMPFDSDLRRGLVRAIFADDRLARYGLGTQPSIRIVVDHGRVTLVGTVATPLDRTLAEFAARGVMSFGVDNRLVVETGR